MKEKLYTIPLMDALRAQDECPLCYARRALEQHAMDFTLGSGASYMEDDIRAQTDKAGFCREHYRQMFAYGNRLGTSLILQTHFKHLSAELERHIDNYSAGNKPSLFKRIKKTSSDTSIQANNISSWIVAQNQSCYICEQIETAYERYLATFFDLFQNGENEFMILLQNGKGFCLPHFGDLLAASERYLGKKNQEKLREILFPLMKENLQRIIEDIEWFQKKFDYRYRDADWKTSKDAVQRAMQKAKGGYPADPPYEQK